MKLKAWWSNKLCFAYCISLIAYFSCHTTAYDIISHADLTESYDPPGFHRKLFTNTSNTLFTDSEWLVSSGTPNTTLWTSVAFANTSTQIAYAASYDAGLYVSLNFGRTFQKLNNSELLSNVTIQKVVCSFYGETVYLLTDHFNSTVLKSDDYGENWHIFLSPDDQIIRYNIRDISFHHTINSIFLTYHEILANNSERHCFGYMDVNSAKPNCIGTGLNSVIPIKIATSFEGQHILLSSSHPHDMYRSINGGASFDKRTFSLFDISNGEVAMSVGSNGQNISVSDNRYTFVSYDSGEKWTIHHGSQHCSVFSSDESGVTLIGISDRVNSSVYLSTDNGRSWNKSDSSPSNIHYTTVVMDAGGTYALAGGNGSALYYFQRIVHNYDEFVPPDFTGALLGFGNAMLAITLLFFANLVFLPCRVKEEYVGVRPKEEEPEPEMDVETKSDRKRRRKEEKYRRYLQGAEEM